ncbi:MAG TPA: DoxX family protein [Holophaga sp.]|nr:DoxX family protein [Holophaga sp.]
MARRLPSWVQRLEGLGPFGLVLLRLVFGFHLIHASFPHAFMPAAQREFAVYLASIGIPFPLAAAYLVHGVEFFGGAALMAGLWVRAVAVPLILNFLVALLVALPGRPYKERFQAIQMLAVTAFFLVSGAGPLSLDGRLESRGDKEAQPNEQTSAHGPGRA